MAEILPFPDRRPVQAATIVSVPELTRDYVRRQLVYAAEAFAVASAEIAGTLVFMADREPLDETAVVFNGETLESALNGILNLMNLRGAAADGDLRRSVRLWLSRNGADHG